MPKRADQKASKTSADGGLTSKIGPNSIWQLGVACVVAAAAGGGLSIFGVKFRVLDSWLQELILGLVGGALIVSGFWLDRRSKAPLAFKTGSRRLDAAMPHEVTVGVPTEVRVQICRASSKGFAATLPKFTAAGEEISKKDVRTGTAALQFPVDPDTGKAKSVSLRILVLAPDFDVAEHERRIELSHSADSGTYIFELTPRNASDRAAVRVRVAQGDHDSPVVVGEVSLHTRITDKKSAAQAQTWTIASDYVSVEGHPAAALAVAGNAGAAETRNATRDHAARKSRSSATRETRRGGSGGGRGGGRGYGGGGRGMAYSRRGAGGGAGCFLLLVALFLVVAVGLIIWHFAR